MAAEQLQIQVSANVSNAVKGLNDLEKGLKSTETAGVKLGSQGLPQVAKGANQANTALVNLGRVVQDAPFGLIGIANNIDPLITSFQNLKTQTGSTGTALKSLVAGLAGPAGIAIAVSVVTSALIAFGPKLDKFLSGISDFQSGLENATKDSLESFKKAEIQFNKLSNIINDSGVSYERQKDALNKVNSELSNYGLKIADVATFQKNASLIGSIYAEIKQKEAKATALASLAAQEYAKQLDIQRKLARGAALSAIGSVQGNPLLRLFGQIKESNASGDLQDLVNDQKEFGKEIDRTNADIQTLINRLKEIPGVTESFKGATSKVKTLQEKINDLLDDYNITIKQLDYEEQITGLDKSNEKLNTNFDFLKRIAVLGGQTSKAYAEIASKTQGLVDAASKFKIDELIKNYQTAITELDIKQAVTGQDQLNARINAATDALVKLRTLGVSPANEEIIRLQNTLSRLQGEVSLREIRKRTEDITKTWERFQLQIDKLNFNKTKEPLDALKSKIDLIGNAITDLKAKGLTDKDLGISILNIQFEQLGAQFEKLKGQKELFDQLQSTIEGGLTNAFTSVFEAIANGEDAFKALGDSVKRLALDLIRVVIQMTVVKALANALAPGLGGEGVDAARDLLKLRGDFLVKTLSRAF
jgi:hypothetical protein